MHKSSPWLAAREHTVSTAPSPKEDAPPREYAALTEAGTQARCVSVKYIHNDVKGQAKPCLSMTKRRP